MTPAKRTGPIPLPLIMPKESAAELKALIAAHRERRPDPLKATAPGSPAHLYLAWQGWCGELAHLQTRLGMAAAHEAQGWRDAHGKRVDPIR